MKFCVLDLECLQPSNQICEIGAVVVDTHKRKVVDVFQILADPGEPITDYPLRHNGGTITDLTGITQEMLDKAPPLQVSGTLFWAWFNKQQVGGRLVSWGNDGPLLYKQTGEKAKQHLGDFKVDFHDIRNLVWLLGAMMPGKNTRGLSASLSKFRLNFVGIKHRAFWDAYNTARLIWRIMEMIDLARYIGDWNVFKDRP